MRHSYDTRTPRIVAPSTPLGQTVRPLALEIALPRLLTTALSDRGRRRARNEDAFELDPELGLAVVADGMGGHPAGDVASRLAAAEVRAYLARQGDSPDGLGDAMVEAVQLADARIRRAAESDPSQAGMGTTLTALLVAADRRRVVIGHVGDSRAYVLAAGRLRQLSRDHTWIQQQIEAGTLTPGDARGHPWAHVLSQALGVGDAIECDVIERDAAPDEIYLLCTDGLTTMLPDVAIERLLQDTLGRGVDAAARALVDAANDRGGVDNITVALVAVEA